ncbi:hypothetical protein XENOCAPTIV_018527, partial [Xenoophorus captivus]
MPATREHLMMVLADLDDILIRASYSTEMRSSSISDISMEVAVPNYSGLAQALEVEQCRCPPGYQGLSCQEQSCTSPASCQVTLASTSAPAKTYAARTGATLRLLSKNVQPEDAGSYVCTGSNMFAMDESSAILYVPVDRSVPSSCREKFAKRQCHLTRYALTGLNKMIVTGGPRNRMSPRAVITNGILTFPAVDLADEGEYTCKALNTHGEHTARASLHVQ